MDIRHILRISFLTLSFCSLVITFFGWKSLKSIHKQLSQKEDTEIVDEKTKRAMIRNAWFMITGTIITSIFTLIAVLLNY